MESNFTRDSWRNFTQYQFDYESHSGFLLEHEDSLLNSDDDDEITTKRINLPDKSSDNDDSILISLQGVIAGLKKLAIVSDEAKNKIEDETAKDEEVENEQAEDEESSNEESSDKQAEDEESSDEKAKNEQAEDEEAEGEDDNELYSTIIKYYNSGNSSNSGILSSSSKNNDKNNTYETVTSSCNSDSGPSSSSSSPKTRKNTTHDPCLDIRFIKDTLKPNNDKIADILNKAFHDEAASIELDSGSTSGQNSDCEFARQESGVGKEPREKINKIEVLKELKRSTARLKSFLSKSKHDDGDLGIQEIIRHQENEIEKLETRELEEDTLLMPPSSQFKGKSRLVEKNILPPQFSEDSDTSCSEHSHLDGIDDIPMKCTTFSKSKELDKQAQATGDEFTLTVNGLQNLYGSLTTGPSENEKIEDPRGLNISLMSHQQHALAWLLWREQQRPSGGILADDMGLGKTLTMIALIIATLNEEDPNDESDDDVIIIDAEEKESTDNKGGTLIVCPASLVSHWEDEILRMSQNGLLSIYKYHSRNRTTTSEKLAKHHIVLTTYNIVAKELKLQSTLFKINWKRIILDEAHIIRNYKSQTAEAVCALVADKRWAVTGTPIQNTELDLYSIFKFLKYSPYDQLQVWKRLLDKKSTGLKRLAVIVEPLMLRRTKQQLIAKGEVESLSEKFIREIKVKLDYEEQLVHDQILAHARNLFSQFLTRCTQEEHDALPSNPNRKTRLTRTKNKLLASHGSIKCYEFFVFLLRLRQVCCFPALIHKVLDQEDVEQIGINMENVEDNLLHHINRVSLNEIVEENRTKNLLHVKNSVFDNDRISSKMKMLLNIVKEILQKGNDKIIIISQWTDILDIIALHLGSIEHATFVKITGNVAIKDRQRLIDSFNDENSGPRILLLSLSVGGVGLNLVGANHLLLYDIHWNPQLEMQAQDRIYRFGQKKDVYIYKFICVNTIEQTIRALQDVKLEIAKNILSGNKSATMNLNLNDFKTLFGL